MLGILHYLFWLGLCLYFIYKHPVFRCVKSNVTYLPVFLIKLLFSYLLIWYYRDYLDFGDTADLFIYYNDSLLVNNCNYIGLVEKLKIALNITSNQDSQTILKSIGYWEREFDYGFYNDNKTMIRLNILMNFISNQNYYINTLFFVFIAFIGERLLIKTMITESNWFNKYTPLLHLLPSVLFFCSGMTKEAFLIGGLGIFFYTIKTIKPISLKKIGYLIIGIFILTHIKIHFSIVIFFTLIIFSCSSLFNKTSKSAGLKITYASILVISILIIISTLIHYKQKHTEKDEIKYGHVIDPIQMIQFKQDDFFYEMEKQRPNSILQLKKSEDISSFGIAIGQGLLNALFQPTPNQLLKKECLPFALENFTKLLFIFIYFFFNKKKKTENNHFITLFTLYFCAISYLIIGFISPVLGNLVKFRAPLDFIVICIFVAKLNPSNFRKLSPQND